MTSNVFKGGKRRVFRVLGLGTGAVTTQTALVGLAPFRARVVGIRFAGQAAVTGTSITADVKKLSADGNTSTTLQSAATSVLLTAGTDETVLSASLTATKADLIVNENTLFEVVITANAITAGPGDLVVDVELEPIV